MKEWMVEGKGKIMFGVSDVVLIFACILKEGTFLVFF